VPFYTFQPQKMVRKILPQGPVAKARNLEKKEVLQVVKKVAPKKKFAYMRKAPSNVINTVSGPTRMRNFFRTCLTLINGDGSSFYTPGSSKSQHLFLPVAQDISKASALALKELQQTANLLSRFYVSRACMLAHSNNRTHSVTVANLRTVDTFFLAA